MIAGFQARRLNETFVAEVTGVDIRALDDDTWRALHDAYIREKVVVLRGQSLDAAAFHAFAERFGPVEPHHVQMFHHPEFPGISLLSNRTEMGRPKGLRDAGSHWHSDYSYKAIPSEATLLYALEVPGEGGDTLFGDLAAAYDDLDDETKRELQGLTARRQYRWHKDRSDPGARWNILTPEELDASPVVAHPVVIKHPIAQRRSLYVFPGISSGVIDVPELPPEESEALLQRLYAHIVAPQYVYRHQWQPGDVVVWDNRSTMHCATTNELPSDRFRTMYRINTTGTTPIPG